MVLRGGRRAALCAGSGDVRAVDYPELRLHDAGAQRGAGDGVLRSV